MRSRAGWCKRCAAWRLHTPPPGITAGAALDVVRVLLAISGMSTEHSQVVVGFDFSHSALAAMYRAIALANRAPFHIFHFLCAIEPHGQIPTLPHHGRVDLVYVER